ncbi:MAG: nuclear transport factor 2 family protein [Pirellulaceae bacterium]|nr:nuclear transport factor 2 family protein [Pirellulaceae bacterium]
MNRVQMITVAESYFRGLVRKDMSGVPWHENMEFRGPLAPGYPEPLRGRAAVQSWLSGLYPVLGEVRVLDHYINNAMTEIVTSAHVSITDPACILRVLDRFVVDESGLITQQENYYDPRMAIPDR